VALHGRQLALAHVRTSPYDTKDEKLHASIGCDSFQQFVCRPAGFLVPPASGEFLMKSIALFGVTLWLLADSIDVTRKQATLATGPIQLRSYARLGARRRINHPGELVVWVMDSSPGLAAVSVRPGPGGIVGPLAGRPS
jgi:hypothetical protein